MGFSFLDTISSVGLGSVDLQVADCVTGRGVDGWGVVGCHGAVVMVQSWEKASTDAMLQWKRGVFSIIHTFLNVI